MKIGKEVEELKRVLLGTRNSVTGEYSFPLLSYYRKEKIFDAAIRAVREDAVQVSKEYLHEAYHRSISEEELLDGIAAVIRKGRGMKTTAP